AEPSPPSLSTRSLHDALPISIRLTPPLRRCRHHVEMVQSSGRRPSRNTASVSACESNTRLPVTNHFRSASPRCVPTKSGRTMQRSEEHTSELQSLRHLVCRLL